MAQDIKYSDIKAAVQGLDPASAVEVAQIAQLAVKKAGAEGKNFDGSPSTSGAVFVPSAIASRCCAPGSFFGGNKVLLSHSTHQAMDNISALMVAFANWYVSNGVGEVAPGGVGTYSATIEYPMGAVIGRLTFGGANTGTAADGATLFSDMTTLARTIPAGAFFFVNSWVSNPAGILYNTQTSLNDTNGTIPSTGECMKFGADAAAIPDTTTTGGAFNNQQANLIYRPLAIIGMSARPSFALCGDSRLGNGLSYDTVSDGYGLVGQLERSLGREFACLNFGCSGERAQQVAAVGGYTRRLALLQYVTHVACNYGINDVLGNRTDTQIKADLETFWALTGKPVFHTTLPPIPGPANSAPGALDSRRVAINGWLRKRPASLAGVFEVADQVESSRDSGLWKAGMFTSDGVHENQAGCLAIQNSGAVSVPLL